MVQTNDEALELMELLGVPLSRITIGPLEVKSPITGEPIGQLTPHSNPEAQRVIARAHKAHLAWRTVPAPRRGELIRLFAEELRTNQADLGRLVTLEAGKILSEGKGEVQEMIDICMFACGQIGRAHV